MRTLSWILYIVGTALVFGNWIGLVPTGIAWLGWLAALIGWMIWNASSRKHGRSREAAGSKNPPRSGTEHEDECQTVLDRIVHR